MDLEELKKKLYKRDQEFKGAPKAPGVFEPGHIPEPPQPEEPSPIKEPQLSIPSSVSLKVKLALFIKKYFFVGLIFALVIILIVAGIMYFSGRRSFDKTLISLAIEGPQRVISGEDVVLKIKIKNETKISLLNPKLIVVLPQESVFENGQSVKTISLQEIKAGKEDEEEFKAKIIGSKGATKTIRARLIYSPKNISSEFENEANFEAVIVEVPLVLNLDLPSKLSSGQTLNLTVKYLNDSQIDFSGLQLKIDYPAGFSFTSAYPSPDEESNVWYIDNLASGTEGKLVVSGEIIGFEEESKPFRVYLGKTEEGIFIPLVQAVQSSQISLSPLSVWQKVNSTESYIARRGETLKFQIKYKNTAGETIKGVTILSKIEGQVLDFSSIEVKSGSFSSINNTITWNQATLPDLEFLSPGQEGEIEFSIDVKDKIAVHNYQDKNFVVTNTVTIDSPNIPLSLYGIKISGESKIQVKLKTDLILSMRGYFYDETFSNYGPLPPKVGQTTTYTVFWEVLNYFNDVKDVKVESFLPPYIKWQDIKKPQEADVKYETSTGKLTWLIGDLPAGTGVLLPVKSLAFQIALVPSVVQVGDKVDLVKEAFISGQDIFVGQEIREGVGVLDSTLPDDSKIGWQEGRVIE